MNLKTFPHSMIRLLSCLAIFTACLARADQGKEVEIFESRSPDGRLRIMIAPDEGSSGGASGACNIREIKTGKLRGTFDWSGFGMQADSTAFKVLWRPDSRCFAISWEDARGHMTGTIYAPYKSGWVELKLPDYMKDVMKLYNAGNVNGKTISYLYGKGCDTPKVWLPHNRLRIEITDRAFTKPGEGDFAYLFWATVRVADAGLFSKPRAILEKVEFTPRSAYPY